MSAAQIALLGLIASGTIFLRQGAVETCR